MELTDNQKRDYDKYYVKKPKEFSPERNRAIIDQTIREYEETLEKRRMEQQENLAERIDAAASYIMYLEKGGGSPAEKYFGKKELARLQGRRILQKYIDITGLDNKLISFEEIDY